MKKLFLSLLLIIPLCGFAQKGMKGVGIGVEYGIGSELETEFGSLTSYGALFKYEYNLTNRIRLSACLNVMSIEDFKVYNTIIKVNPNTPNKPANWYGEKIYEITDKFTNQSSTNVIFGFEFNFFFNGIRRFRPYLLYGMNFGYSSLTTEKVDDTNYGIRFGYGLNWRLTHNSSLQLELPIKYINMWEIRHSYDTDSYYYQGDILDGYYYGERTNGYYDYLYFYQDIGYIGICPSIIYVYTF